MNPFRFVFGLKAIKLEFVAKAALVAKTALIATLFLAPLYANAALVGLTPNKPDISVDDVQVVYDWTNAGGGSGTLTLSDNNSVAGVAATMFFSDGSSFEGFFGLYELIANFDSNGDFSDGTLTITHYSGAIPSLGSFTSGSVLLSADIVDFGFEGTNSAGVFDFVYDNIGGVLADVYLGAGGGTVGGSGQEGTILSPFDVTANSPIGTWTQSMFLSDFSGSGDTTNFIPLPGAYVFYISASAILVGLRKRIAWNSVSVS